MRGGIDVPLNGHGAPARFFNLGAEGPRQSPG
jgi:hypothetical protein